MARLPRLNIAGYAQHVMSRGNNAQATFLDATDKQFFLELLRSSAKRFSVAIHAYVLMDNHYHLLLTPSDSTGMAMLMRKLGKDYTDYFNRKYQRLGALWQGRYKSSLVQSESYLLACMVYIDLNPVRAHLCAQAGDYAWSSYAHLAGLQTDALVSPHAMYWALGNTPFDREAAYRDLVAQGMADDRAKRMTKSVRSGLVTGDAHFIHQLQQESPHRITAKLAGRPNKSVPGTNL